MNIQIPVCGGGKSKRETKLLRGKTKKICELLGYTYDGSCWAHYGDGDDTPAAFLPNGCLILKQVVGMLADHSVFWQGDEEGMQTWIRCRETDDGRVEYEAFSNHYEAPHDLLTAMDALIGVLEKEKK